MRKLYWIALFVVWAISVGYMATHLKRGWVPHDEGTLGGSAERVLNGELPNRDFDDYTGGLTLVHALAFREFGINSVSMRIVLFAFFVLWVPAVFYIASRFGSAYSASAVALLAVAWSVPNYPGPMPSWYNLFFASFGAAALLRYLEAGSRRWLYFAGICGGLSILAKITGAYYVAGVLLFFVFREQTIANEKNGQAPIRARLYSATVTLTLAVFLALLFRTIHQISGIRVLIYFVLPAFSLVILLLVREYAGIAGHNWERFSALLSMCIPFGVGVAAPLLVFLVPYLSSGSVHDLVHRLILASSRAIHFAMYLPESPVTIITIIPFAVPALIAYQCERLGRAICGSIIASYVCALLVFSGKASEVRSVGWFSLLTSIPALVLAGVAILWTARGQLGLRVVRQQQIMLITCLVALCSLVQFPFAKPIYFCYVAPLVIILAAALFFSTPHPPRFALGALAFFYLTLVLSQSMSGAVTERLTIARAGGLSVDPSDAELYDQLIPLVQAHAAGKFIYAAPDCPEVYFLSGLKSPSRHYFDFAEESDGQTGQILNSLDSLGINLITINLTPRFSDPMDVELRAALDQRFPHSADIGHFEVRWKE